jgi:hypothetical protein
MTGKKKGDDTLKAWDDDLDQMMQKIVSRKGNKITADDLIASQRLYERGRELREEFHKNPSDKTYVFHFAEEDDREEEGEGGRGSKATAQGSAAHPSRDAQGVQAS